MQNRHRKTNSGLKPCPLEQINWMRLLSNSSSLRGAKRRGNPGGLLDCHGPAGLAMTAVSFELPLVDLL
jgi:hypothetical protein